MSPKKIPASPSEIGVTKLGVGGFKSIDTYIEADIKPLTILAGANSSGKSSFMQPLLLMKQTLESSIEPASPLQTIGPNLTFFNFDEFFSRGINEFCVSLEFPDPEEGESLKNVFKKTKKDGIKVLSTQLKSDDLEFILKEGMTSEEIQKSLPEELHKIGLRAIGGSEKEAYWTAERERYYLAPTLRKKEAEKTLGSFSFPYRFGYKKFDRFIKSIIHLPGLRKPPERYYYLASVSEHYPGIFSDYFASVIFIWNNNNDPRLTDLNLQMNALELTSNVISHKIDDTHIVINVNRILNAKTSEDQVNIADVGFGVSQVLPVLVALLAAEPGQLVYIEQPELHLHPKAQMHLAEILATAAKRGVRVVIETHSEIILRGVQTLIAEGQLDHNIVAMHWFERDQKTGSTTIRTADLDEYGRFGDWPEDFSSTMMKVENRYFDAAEEKLKRDSQKS